LDLPSSIATTRCSLVEKRDHRIVGLFDIFSWIAGSGGLALHFQQEVFHAALKCIRVDNRLATGLNPDDPGEDPLVQQRKVLDAGRGIVSRGGNARGSISVTFRHSPHLQDGLERYGLAQTTASWS